MFKNLKSLFITENDNDLKKALERKAAAEEEGTETPAPVQQRTPPPTPRSTPTSSNTGGEIDDKFINILFGAMEKANMQGFDYIEYKQSLRNLAKIQMDEATRFKSAYAAAQTMGATPQKLLDSATHYMNVLSQEEHKFKAALVNQRSKQIGDKEQQIQNLAAQIKIKEDQIAQLTKEIETDKTNMENMKADISDASVKVDKTENDFVASYNALVGQIQTDAEKIKQYLM